MQERSHVDIGKLNKVPSGHPFEYKDVVEEDFPVEEHTLDGKRFKREVESGAFDNVKVDIDRDTDNRILYRKL